MPGLVVIGPQIKEKQRGAQYIYIYISYMVPKDPSLNSVKPFAQTYGCGNSG